MAQIPRAAIDYLNSEVNGISADAKAKVALLLGKLDWRDVPACRDAVVSAVNAVLDAYCEVAGQAAADFFDASRELSVGERLGAVPVTERDAAATEGAIRAFVDRAVHGDVAAFNRLVLSRVDYEIRLSTASTMLGNAARDPLNPRYARVPSGTKTCGFCLMLASRGFVYHSDKTAGAFRKFHSDCDCKIVCEWDDDGAEGYDPDSLYELWRESMDGRRGGAKLEEGWAEGRSALEVDMNTIESKSYGRAVSDAFGGRVPDTARDDVLRMLRHRTGTAFEDLYAYDVASGKRLDSVVTSKTEREVRATERMARRIRKAIESGGEVALLHNHPSSSIPSAADIASIKASGASFGVIACHDGTLYRYSLVGDPMPGYTVDDESISFIIRSAKNRGKSEAGAFIALEEKLGVKIEHLF